ncbi:MAG: hypothetical protein J6K19_06860 [Prevotella sp.]|nr:hypothetical protein [Prevotella sp.]
MKHLYLFILYAVLSLQYASAQDGTSVSVHVDGELLENLLTDEQKKTVRDLRITGRLQADDYAYLRNSLLEQLDTLNLRDADIDTIPVRAFVYEKENTVYSRRATIILPKSLVYISEEAIQEDENVVLTGMYPVYENNFNFRWINLHVSSDNEYLKENEFRDIYSIDGDTIYKGSVYGLIAEGTKVISSYMYMNHGIAENGMILLPATICSIGDMAFAYIEIGFLARSFSDYYNTRDLNFICEAPTPPKLGKDVFASDSKYFSIRDIAKLYVPKVSIELYKEADGWREFKNITDLESISKSGISGCSYKRVSIKDEGYSYVIASDHVIKSIAIYDFSGKLHSVQTVNTATASIPKLIFSSPYCIIRINYNDGTKESIKIKP